MSEANDDLSEILAPKQGQPSTDLRARLLLRTESRLVRQRWVRKSVRVGGVGFVFLLGGLAGYLARPIAPAEAVPRAEPEIVFVPLIVPVPSVAEGGSSSIQEVTQQFTGSQAELQAELADDPKVEASLYKVAGDAFLRDQDYANASRCYRMFLVRAGDGALSINPDDSWLLTSLKNAIFKEKSHVLKADS